MSTNEVKHTPTPWAKDAYGQLRGANGKQVDTKRLGLSQSLGGGEYPEAEENSAFILRAVNSHELLLERLQAIIDWADLALASPDQFNSHGVKNLAGPIFDEARAVLAKVVSQ